MNIRKTLIILALFLAMGAQSQELNIPKTDSTTQVGPDLYRIAYEYFQYVSKDSLIDMNRFTKLEGVNLSRNMMGIGAWGITAFDGKQVYLNTEIPWWYPEFQEMILWHEMWHVYCLSCEHSEDYFFSKGVVVIDDLHLWNDEAKKNYLKFLRKSNELQGDSGE